MERRLLSFIIASTAFFFFYISMRVMFGPPPVPNVAQNAAGDVADIDENGDVLPLDGDGTDGW